MIEGRTREGSQMASSITGSSLTGGMGSLLKFFQRRGTAPVARDRLQILLAHERAAVGGQSDLVAILREEILAVIKKHVSVDADKVMVKMDRGAGVSTLEVDIEIPGPAVTGTAPALALAS